MTAPHNLDHLLMTLRAIARPAEAESWLHTNPIDADPTADQAPSDAEGHAATALLQALGALINAETVSSPMGYYFVQSLIVLFEDAQREGVDLATAWQRNANLNDGLGARLVNTIETFRLEAFAQPTALRSIAAVLAVITKRQDDQQYCLMQFDEKADQFQPLGGKREADDPTVEAALLRELAEELNLDPLASDSCQLVPLVLNKRYQQVSATLQVITQYEHSFYHVRAIRFPLVVDDLTRWISLNEIRAGVTHDGRKISPLVLSLSLETLESLSTSL